MLITLHIYSHIFKALEEIGLDMQHIYNSINQTHVQKWQQKQKQSLHFNPAPTS